jgi:hypothetical protein
LLTAGLAVVWGFTRASAGHAGTLEKLVMPGPLAEAHARYEDDCGRCHEAFDKKQQRRLCLACHDTVAKDLERKEGFHGRTREAATVECRHCHPDHAGRDADILGLDIETFDHAVTDFVLRDAHSRAECSACHPSGRKHRDAPVECSGCHRSDDPHRGALGERCADCHAEGGWRRARFDHGRTRFALAGAHARTACAACHPDQHYAGTPRTCSACHAVDDVHRGQRGARCEQCHDSARWERARFDHGAATGFVLRGLHTRLGCESCHAGGVFSRRLSTDCVGCHRSDDPHDGKQGTACERCHHEDGWQRDVRFDHDLTDFPLLGLHGVVACEQCHASASYEGAPNACAECHTRDDAHAGRLGADCAACHNPNGWGLWSFDHAAQTRFALDGAHAGLACDACHLRPPGEVPAISASCSSCHARDDVHRGAFGARCELCHSTSDFSDRRSH